MSDSDKTTDDSKLVTTDTVYVSPESGTTNEAFPQPNVEYDFRVDVTNAGQLSSRPFFVQFSVSGDQDPPKDLDFAQNGGLDPGTSIKAVVHFGTFPNQFATYRLAACIYSSSPPENAINCAGSFDIAINTESTSDSGSGGSDDTRASATTSDSEDFNAA